MTTSNNDKTFAGSIPKLYDTYLVPLIFESYATDMVNRLNSRPLSKVLEIAAGTGVVTRAMASGLPESVSIVATDLNQAMLDEAAAIGIDRPVEWRQADAMELPFPDETFDAVVCQFGVMFFPDKPKALSQAWRVLKPGGIFIFSIWDKLAENEFADTITTALESLFPDDPPRFLPRAPYGYYDFSVVEQDLANGGFTATPRIDTIAVRSRATSALIPAIGYCQGCPLKNEIESRDPLRLDEATNFAAEAIAKRFGQGAVDGKIQAHIITVEK
jgi:SAM-dependent methyltransferase